MNYQNFTSLPPEEEQQFVVFERQSVESQKSALTIGLIVAGALGFLLILIQLTVTPTPPLHTDALDDDLGSETAEPSAPAPSAAPTPAPSEPAATEPGTEAAPTEAAPTEAPTPPKGATKAPPTALIK